MLDVERVEILKGPQGILFGRNTIGGAISIVTREPGDEYMFKGEITGGSYSRIEVQGTGDLPVSDRLLTTVSFSYKTRDGFQDRIPFPTPLAGSSGIPDCDGLAAGTPCPVVDDGFRGYPAAGYESSSDEGGLDSWSVRGKAVFLATDDLKLTFTADYTDVDQSATPTTQLNISPIVPVLPGSTPPGSGFAGVYNQCLNGDYAPNFDATGAFSPADWTLLCTSMRLDARPIHSPVTPLPALGNVNNDGDQTNNRLPYDSRFISPDIDKTYANGNSFSKLENWGVAGIIDWDILDGMHLRSITGYRDLHWKVGMDLDGAPISILEPSFDMPQDQISQELQLTGTVFDNSLDYVLGFYYFHEEGSLHDWVIFPGGLLMIDGPNDLATDAYAGFGHLSIHLTDDITLIAGGRYSYEHKTFEGKQSDGNGFNYKAAGCFPAQAPGFIPGLDCQQTLAALSFIGPPFGQFPTAAEPYRYYPPGERSLNFKNFSPIVGIQYRANDDMMFYVTFSQGYKTGSWTTRLSQPHPTYDPSLFFDPETATSQEGGMKSDWLDGRLRVNLAGFHTTYSNIQLNSQQGISPTLLNAGDARMYGFEVESQAEFGMGFSVTAALGWIDAKYKRVNPGVGDNGVQVTTDFELPKTPEWKFNISPQYVMNLPVGGALRFNLDYTYIDELYNDLGNTELLKRDAVDMLNVSATYMFPNDKFEISVGGTNVLDERYIVTGQFQGGVSNIYGTYSDPAMWYATLRARYD
jgi:iron complex outermembrane receptor protein